MSPEPQAREPAVPPSDAQAGTEPVQEAARAAARWASWQTLLSAGILILVVAGSLGWNLWGEHYHAEELAWVAARGVADTVVALRAWTAEQGGVYVPVGPRLAPNPYLDAPDRDVTDSLGRRLTKVNPAYLTRLVAACLPPSAGVRIRLVSDRPLRPRNRPEGWEVEALTAVSAGGRDEWGRVAAGPTGRREFEYLRPLLVKPGCLTCHAKQGYREGDLRGGLSVVLDYESLAAEDRARMGALVGGHAVALAAGLWAVLWLGARLRARAKALEIALGRVRVLEGILPICASCKKIRVEGGDPGDPEDWEPVEAYVMERSHAQFSHGLCPECLDKLYPDLRKRRPQEKS
ncbi:Tll0287-like domain-containing protein [Deferrisoma palaeochoriense]